MQDQEIPGYVRRTVSDQRATYMRSAMAFGRAEQDCRALDAYLFEHPTPGWNHWCSNSSVVSEVR